jgi:hypothetical protein
MLRAMAKKENMHNGDLCINMNNHQNAIFHQFDNFMHFVTYINTVEM